MISTLFAVERRLNCALAYNMNKPVYQLVSLVVTATYF